MFITTQGRAFMKDHAEKGRGGWECKTTGAPIQQIAVEHFTGMPAFEPGDPGTRIVHVQHIWCPECGTKPKVEELEGSYIDETSLVPLH